MRYLEWNKAIGNYFFNPNKAGKDVLLFISLSAIGQIGIRHFNFATEEESLADFYNAIRAGFPLYGKNDPVTTRAEKLYNKWKSRNYGLITQDYPTLQIDGINITDQKTKITYPFYLAMLALFILPLTSDDGEFRANAYYPRLNKFLTENKLDTTPIDISSFKEIHKLWDDLCDWSVRICKTDIGIFRNRHIGNRNWIHVGRVFAQCVLTPYEIKCLPRLFSAAGFMPGTLILATNMRNAILRYGQDIGISTNTIKILREGDKEIQKVILDIACTEHSRWQGNIERKQGETIEAVDAWVYARLLSAFTIDKVNEEMKHSYFVYSSIDYPDGLQYSSFLVEPLSNGFSKPIKLNFNPRLTLVDNYNKWRSAPVTDDIILYRSGINCIPHNFWVETDKLYPTSTMYLLCTNSKSTSIENWGERSFTNGNFKKEKNLEGIPTGYNLYKISNPCESHPDEIILQLQTDFEIQFIGGLKVRNRAFLCYYLPVIHIEGIGEMANVYAQFANQRIDLIKSQNTEEWRFPDNVLLDQDFIIKVEGIDNLESYPHQIVSNAVDVANLQENNHRKRDNFGDITEDVADIYCIGNNVNIPNYTLQAGAYPAFETINQKNKPYIEEYFEYTHSKGNTLLYYLSYMGECNSQTFGLAFDTVFQNENLIDTLQNRTLKIAKRYSLIYLDHLGYIDFDQEIVQIQVNKPQIMLIPSETEVKAYLTGARTEKFVEQLFEFAKQNSIAVTIEKQDRFYEGYLIPDTIILTPRNCENSTKGRTALESLAGKLGICFDFIDRPVRVPKIIQWGLRHFSARLNAYRSNMYDKKQTDGTDYHYRREVFNPDTFKFIKSDEGEALNQELSLVQYNIHYEWLYRFWENSKCYDVDKNWGQFLLLAGHKKSVIYYDEENLIVASPAHVQLPRYIAKSLILLSGKIPYFRSLTINGNTLSYQLYVNIPKTFADNLFKKLDQEVQLFKF